MCKETKVKFLTSHQNNNLLEIAFESAFERAAELDAYFKENSKLIGPLHGLPFTSKDQFHLKGLPATMGYVGWIGTFEGEKGTGKEDTTESELITSLHSLGAIPIAKVSRGITWVARLLTRLCMA